MLLRRFRFDASDEFLVIHEGFDKLDKSDLIVLDELSYVRKDLVETNALFKLIAHRYERHPIAVTANEPFSGWSDVFSSPAMTVAAISCTTPLSSR